MGSSFPDSSSGHPTEAKGAGTNGSVTTLQDAADGPRDPYPAESCLHHLLQAQAAATPDAVAVVFEDQTLTYGELDRRANALAHRLQSLGVQPDVAVGISVERSLDLVVAVLAVLKSGAAYLPLEPHLPAARLAFMLEEAEVPILVTQSHLTQVVPHGNATVVCTDDAQVGSVGPVTSSTRPEHLAYLMYTSGSTGRPKGVQIPHRALVNFLWSVRTRPGLTAEDVLVAVTPLSFDISGLEIFLPLLVGARVVLASRAVTIDGWKLGQLLQESGATVMQATPAGWRLLLEAGWPPVQRLKILCGGEAMSSDLARALVATGGEVWNLYGPTETTIWSTAAHIEQVGPFVPLGGPIANTSLHVLDDALQPVTEGEVGLLYIGGDGLARGYLKRPELTSRAFLDTSWGRLYSTGDRVRRHPDATLEFLGRSDHQIKIHGYRVEAGEIESRLRQHPAVADAVVVLRQDADQPCLVGYVTPRAREAEAAHSEQFVRDWGTVWQTVYDEAPQEGGTVDPAFKTSGINSSYTQQPLPENETREMIDLAATRIRTLGGRHFLDLGCGAGLLLFRLAREADRYVGTDLSARALEHVREHLGTLSQVELFNRPADDITGLEPATFDVVILNSIVQYFPDVAYLRRVLVQAVRLVKPGGHVFVGDVRNLHLLEAFHASVVLRQAAADVSRDVLRSRVDLRMAREKELVIDPDFFVALQDECPELAGVDVHMKAGHYHNEFTRFRYDAILHVGVLPDFGDAPTVVDWQEQGLSIALLPARLEALPPTGFHATNIPNARLSDELQTLQWLRQEGEPADVGALRASLVPLGVDPQHILDVARNGGYDVHLTFGPGTRTGTFDATFWRPGGARPRPQTPDKVLRPWSSYVTSPVQSLRRVEDYRTFLRAWLPEPMIPTDFVQLESFPLSPNGKLDRAALPAPTQRSRATLSVSGGGGPAYQAPRNESELRVALAWESVLRRHHIGIHENFFDIGGNSLLAVRLVVTLEKQAGRKLPLALLFDGPTIAELAANLGRGNVLGEVAAEALVPLRAGGARPPLYLIHDNTGGVAMYRGLVDRLDPDQPVYGVKALRSGEGWLVAHTRLGEMAAYYISQIRQLQPRGPYYLAGLSFGGMIAFEMAQQLLETGDSVALVGLFDVYGLNYPRFPSFWHRAMAHIRNILSLTGAERADYIRIRLAAARELANRLVWDKVYLSLRGCSRPLPKALTHARNAGFVPTLYEEPRGNYPGRVDLFKTERQPVGCIADATLGWSTLVTGRLEVHEVPGYHGFCLVEPNVQVLAERFKVVLQELQEVNAEAPWGSPPA